LLDVSRIARGAIELRKRSVELSHIVIRAIEVVSPLVEQRQQRLDVQVQREGLLVDADLERMAQVLGNLLTNASKYSDPRSRILVTARRVGSRVRCSVKDEGVGIAPEMLQGVFEPFVQQPGTVERSRGGLGLGLAIVRSLVIAHGGVVRAVSEGLGRGSEFIVELPALERLDTRVDGLPK
jgi:signal transduction histidine kinase